MDGGVGLELHFLTPMRPFLCSLTSEDRALVSDRWRSALLYQLLALKSPVPKPWLRSSLDCQNCLRTLGQVGFCVLSSGRARSVGVATRHQPTCDAPSLST